jgi:hypothetical protein
LRAAFVACDAAYRRQAIANGDVSGTTALVALLRAHRLYIANAVRQSLCSFSLFVHRRWCVVLPSVSIEFRAIVVLFCVAMAKLLICRPTISRLPIKKMRLLE